ASPAYLKLETRTPRATIEKLPPATTYLIHVNGCNSNTTSPCSPPSEEITAATEQTKDLTPTVMPPTPPCAKDGITVIRENNDDPSSKIVGYTCTKFDTAIGTIDTTPEGVIKSIYAILLGLSGGIALILIIIAGYQLIMSHGEPEKIKEAREQITA